MTSLPPGPGFVPGQNTREPAYPLPAAVPGYASQQSYPDQQGTQSYWGEQFRIEQLGDEQEEYQQYVWAEGEAELPREPAYVVPEAAPAGWSARGGRRRTWLSRGVLFVIMVMQAVLSLRLGNTAFQDEALYVFAGHMEIDHLFHGASMPYGYNAFFSGSPVLYPVLAGAADSFFGLAGARALSLVFMLSCTGLLYAMSRRLFNERVALFAAGVFAVSQSTIVLGWFATYDSPALFLLALSAWLVVRTARAHVLVTLLAAPVLLLAFCTKYAAGIFVPTVIALAVLSAWPYKGARALWRGVLLSAALGVLGYFFVLHSSIMAGIQSTTTSRAHGTDAASSLLNMSADWIGVAFALAAWGAFSYIRRARVSEVAEAAQEAVAYETSTFWRFCLCTLLLVTGLLATAYQIHLATSVSLYKHVGFGLFFFAPLAGLGVSRIIGPHFRRTEIGMLLIAVVLSSGIAESQWRFDTWPNTGQLINVLRPLVNDKGAYLADTAEVPTYYLRNITKGTQWASTYYLGYTDKKGQWLTGPHAYTAAIDEGHFDLVLLQTGGGSPANDAAISAALTSSGRYRLYAALPFSNSVWGSYQIWLKN